MISTPAESPTLPIATPQTVSSPPDIYFIVLDAYSRADVLEDLYGFDNSEFIQFLQSRGFVVPAESRSNYAKTVLSVTSTLNMDYVESLQPRLDVSRYWWLMSPYFERSRVRVALEQIGYRSVSVATGWNLTDNETTDVYYSPHRFALSDFESFFLARTPFRTIRPLFEQFEIVSTYRSHREAILYTFGALAEIPTLPAPKFVFAHVFAPHPPFVFDAHGNPVPPVYAFGFNDANDFPFSDTEYRDGYVGQVRFVNKKLMSVVDAILRESNTPPIVILQADHGPRMLGDFRSYQSTCLKESFATFSAYFLPGAQKSLIPENVTPVNLFRIIFNHYFDGNFPLLESRNFYDAGNVLADVTNQINTCSGR